MRRIAALLVLLLLLATKGLVANAAPPPAAYRIAGVVIDSLTGQPLSGAQVTIAPLTALDQEQTFLTSADGRFVFNDLPAAKFRLTAGRRGYANQGFYQHEGYMTAIVTGPRHDTEHIRFPLAPGAVLAGAVTDEWGDPVRDAKVLLFQQSMFDGSQTLHKVTRTMTDYQGRYRFAHLSSGTYAVAVYARPWYTRDPAAGNFFETFTGQAGPAEDSSETSVASDNDVSLQPTSLGPLFDVVYPVTFFPGATRLADATRLSLTPGATETADFQLRTVPSVHLRVSVPVEPPVAVTTHDGDQETTVQVDSSADVAASLHIGEGFTDQLQPTHTEIAPGIVELSGIPPGQIDLFVSSLVNLSSGTYVSRVKTIDVSGDTAIDLTPQGPPATVSGVVLANQFSQAPSASTSPDADQLSVEGPSSITLSFRSLQSGESYNTAVSNTGKFSFAGSVLPAGSYEVEVSQGVLQVSSLEATGAKVSGRTIEVPAGEPVELVVHTMEAKSTLSGFALKNSKPVAGAMILLVPQDSGRNGPLYRRDQSDSDGSFSLGPLFPGRYTLLAIENGWDLEWADPAVLFRYLPGGQPIEIPLDGSVTRNAKVQ